VKEAFAFLGANAWLQNVAKFSLGIPMAVCHMSGQL
jgi:hypothetical protein